MEEQHSGVDDLVEDASIALAVERPLGAWVSDEGLGMPCSPDRKRNRVQARV